MTVQSFLLALLGAILAGAALGLWAGFQINAGVRVHFGWTLLSAISIAVFFMIGVIGAAWLVSPDGPWAGWGKP